MGFRQTGFDTARADALIADYTRDGYAIVRGLFTTDEVAEIAAAVDQVHREGVAHGRSFRHGNLFYNVSPAATGAGVGDMPVVRMVQWMSYHQSVLNAVRTDPRIASVLKPLIGGDLKQIINQLHWKATATDSAPSGDFAWHQDSQFRKPDHAYRRLGEAYVQTGLAIDPHTPESGAMRFVRGSHRHGALDLDTGQEVLGRAMADDALTDAGLELSDIVDLVLEPGDFAMWSPYLVHGSGTNTSDHQRRLYINGYVRAEDCDRGEWAFRAGQPVPFGAEQAIVHYEELRERPDPHYV